MPLVTVITITYNSANYVRDAIESVLQQDYSNIEYIIGDDCSTDNTWEIIQEYHDPRINAYRNEINLREYPNRNKALSLATGKYLIYVDGDDLVFQHGIRQFVEQLERFPQAAFALQKTYQNNLLYPALFKGEEIIRNFYYSVAPLMSTSLASNFFRTEILKEAGGFPQGWIAGDEELRLRLASRYPVLVVAAWLTWPRETPGQASSRLAKGSGLLELYRMTRQLFSDDQLKLGRDLEKDILRFLEHRLVRMAAHFFIRFRWAVGFRLLAGIGRVPLWRDFFYTPSYKDSLAEYSPEHPFRNGFYLHNTSAETKTTRPPQ